MKKIILLIALVSIVAVFTVGCGSGPKEPVSLPGNWKVSNNTFNMTANITDDSITIYWENEDTKSLYWAGTFKAPENGEDPYTWVSKNDHSQTDNALLASSDDTKQFTCEKGELRFEASAMCTTSTVRMKKQ